jgi:Domain of unknown function (DUF2383)
MNDTTSERDLDQLNAMLRGERSAVETYGQCIEKLATSRFAPQLAPLKASHASRVGKLTSQITQLGGEADTTSGAWGSLAKLIEGGAAVFGEKPAIAALEEGEDHGKKTYAELADLTEPVRAFVQRELVPEQKQTHDALLAIKKAM